jgi:hypothetical protein
MKRIAFVLILVAVSGGIVAYFVRPTRMELVSTPPPEFLQPSPEWDARRREIEAQVARAYWECALVTLQWRYSYGVRLPETPPDEFQVESRVPAAAVKLARQSRQFYWDRLRKAWDLPQSWRQVRVWDFEWFDKPLEFWKRAIGV